MKEWYTKKLADAEAKAKAAAEMGDYAEYQRWEKEADNYRKMINQ